MAEPVIIAVAITGALPRKKDNPAVAVTPTEQIESTHEAYEAGASLVHIHVRNPDESPSSAPDLYAKVQEGVRKHCPGMIVQFSTGGRGREQSARGAMLHLKPDMASLATGSVNFPASVYENPSDFVEGLAKTMLENGIKPEVEVFDLAMLYNAASLVKKGLLKSPPHVQFVLGIPNATPARRSSTSCGRRSPTCCPRDLGCSRHRALPMGGESVVPGDRRPLPDGSRGQHAVRSKSTGREQWELVQKIVDVCKDYDRRPATPADARKILGLPART